MSRLVFVHSFLFLFKAAEPLVKSLRPHSKAVICLAADDKYIVSGSTDCTVAMYDRRAGRALKRLRVRSRTILCSFSLHLHTFNDCSAPPTPPHPPPRS